MSRSLLRIFAALAVALLLLGACGGDDDEGAESPPAETNEPADDDTTTTADDEADDTTTTEGGGTADDEADDTTTTEGGGTDPADINPAAISDFCGVFTVFTEVEDPFLASENAMDPDAAAEALRDGFTMFGALLQRAAQLAPDEIEADMTLMAEGIGEFNEAMAEYDYDLAALMNDPEVDPAIEEGVGVLDSADFIAASDNIEAFVLEECGIDVNPQ